MLLYQEDCVRNFSYSYSRPLRSYLWIATDEPQVELMFEFINRYRDTWPAGISVLEGDILDLAWLVSDVFPLDGALDAMDMCSDNSEGNVKVQIVHEIDVVSAFNR